MQLSVSERERARATAPAERQRHDARGSARARARARRRATPAATRVRQPRAARARDATRHATESEGRDTLENQQNSGERPFFIGGCHSWRTDGPIVAAMFPQFATKPVAKD